MGLWADWRASRERQQRVTVYLNHLLRDPDGDNVAWLADLCGDRTIAARELMFAKRALGLIVAERDALDDRTAAEVAHLLAPIVSGEARRDPVIGREWADRWRAYTTALAVRGSHEAPAARLGRVMLSGAGVPAPGPDQLARAARGMQEMRGALNEQLRAALGAAALPEDVRPSALRG